jgi:hypothetical protein
MVKSRPSCQDCRTILAHKYPGLPTGKRSTAESFVGSAAAGVTRLPRKDDEYLWAERCRPPRLTRCSPLCAL